MTAVTLRGITCPETFIVPQNEGVFLSELRQLVQPAQHKQIVDDLIGRSVLSIRHKLSVAMYHSALVRELNPIEFARLKVKGQPGVRLAQPIEVTYKGCRYQIYDIEEYRLFMALFVETFAATACSLLDVAGHLLNDLYQLGMAVHKIDYDKVVDRLSVKPIHTFLSDYRSPPKPTASGAAPAVPGTAPAAPGAAPAAPAAPGATSPVSTIKDWIEPLREIRNRITHRPFTELYEIQATSSGKIYGGDDVVEAADFFLEASLYKGNRKRLVQFVQEVYDGIEYFTEELYDQLRQAVITTKSRTNTFPLV